MRYPDLKEVAEAVKHGTVYKDPMYNFFRQFPLEIWKEFLPQMRSEHKRRRTIAKERRDRLFSEAINGTDNNGGAVKKT